MRSLRFQHIRRLSTSKSDLSSFGNVFGGSESNERVLDTFKTWHRLVASAKESGPSESHRATLAERVHPDCTFHPPTYYKHWVGRDKFMLIIGAVIEVFGKSFVYGRQWLSPDGKEWALEFTAEIGDSGKKITGIDLVTLNDDGQIVDFKVLARPPNAVAELKAVMTRKVGMSLVKNSLSSLFGSK